jgi:Phage integrase, N-terminal SAM-like domain
MLTTLSHKGVKVRNPTPRVVMGAPLYTGAVRYRVIGSVEGFDPDDISKPPFRQIVRLALGTEDERSAIRRVEKIRTAYLAGADSSHWPELKSLLPRETFDFFTSRVGYREPEVQVPANGRVTGKATWSDLREIFEAEMKESVENKKNGATEKRIMAPRTEKRYQQTLDQFEAHLSDKETYLENIKPATIELFKAARRKQIESLLKQCSAGGGIALDVAILHRVFRFAIDKGLMQH